MHIAKLPTAVPLPFGHGIESTPITDSAAMDALLAKLSTINVCLAIWLQAIHYSHKYFNAMSLDNDTFNIPKEFFQPLAANGQIQWQICVSVILLVPNFLPAKQVLAQLAKVQESNIDLWIQDNKLICNAITDEFTPFAGGSNMPPLQNQPPAPIQVNIPKTATEEKNEVRKQKALVFSRILLSSINTDTNELIPAKLSEALIELVEDSTAKNTLHPFQELFKSHTKNHCSNTSSIKKN